MLWILTSWAGLLARYGQEGAERLRDKLIESAAKLAPARVLIPDHPLAAGALEFEAVTMQGGGSVRAALALLHEKVQAGTLAPPSALLLVGGDGIVPFYREINPCQGLGGDPDAWVLTDNPYGLTDPEALRQSDLDAILAPPLPVGRIPDSDPPDLDVFLKTLGHTTHRAGLGSSEVFAVSDTAFLSETRTALAGQRALVRAVPGWSRRASEWQQPQPRRFFFNLHGFDQQKAWRAFRQRSGGWVDVIVPADVDSDQAKGSIVVCENCYGAQVAGRSPSSSIALAFLAHGTRAFFGATGLAFGSHLSGVLVNLDNAAQLVREVLTAMHASSYFGEALRRAQRHVTAGHLNAFAKKTALQFVLYGNPLARL